MKQNNNPTFLSFLRLNWVIVLAIIGLISGWVQIKNDVTEASTRVEKVETSQEIAAANSIQVTADLVEVKTTLRFIEQKIDDLNEKVTPKQ